MNNIYLIPQIKIYDFEKKLKKLQRKGKKLGFHFTYALTGNVDFKEVEGNLFKFVEYNINSDISDKLVINGWQMVGKFDHTLSEGVLVHTIPNNEIDLSAYYNVNSNCDHCNINRNRHFTYLLENISTKERKQVGSTCLKDFLGHDNPNDIAEFYENIWLLDEDEALTDEDLEYNGSSYNYYFSVEKIITLGVSAIRQYGWVSKSMVKNSVSPLLGTYIIVEGGLIAGNNFEDDRYLSFDVKDETKAIEVISWIINTYKDSNNSYEHNLYTLIMEENLPLDKVGYVISAINNYNKYIAEKNQQNLPEISQYLGENGDKLKGIKLYYIDTPKTFRGRFGTNYLNRFKTSDGLYVVWITSKNYEWISEDDDTNEYLLERAIIKDTNDTYGYPQTVIKNAKLIVDKS